ncbi:glycosyltransferase family 2 protein [Candidatus Woesearchaeota archaeon]|nr:glycosyltransferase family 2 protein [Candidatus Woesearchaeota archaeon]
MKDKISIIIPTRNEERTIGTIIKQTSKYSSDIIVVDGHSKDSTRDIAQSLKARVILDNSKGKGAALRIAVQNTTREIVLFMDADGSHETSDIPRLIKPILEDKADLVVASRMLGGSDVQ